MPRMTKAACVSPMLSTSIVWRSNNSFRRSQVQKACAPIQPMLLWIDDFEPGLILYKAMFENLGFKVLTANSGEAGIQLASVNPVDIVVTDYEMPGMNGLGVASSIKKLNPRIPVILFSGSTLVPLRARRTVDAFCDKAESREKLLAVIHRLLGRKRSESLQPPPVARASDQGHRTVA